MERVTLLLVFPVSSAFWRLASAPVHAVTLFGSIVVFKLKLSDSMMGSTQSSAPGDPDSNSNY